MHTNEQDKTKPPPKCACGKHSHVIEFTTFWYWYCKDCKVEVKYDTNRYVSEIEEVVRNWNFYD